MSEEPNASILSAALFPGREKLYAHEVAQALRLSTRHVLNLILEKEIEGHELNNETKKTSINHWRITTAAYDDFIRRRSSSARIAPKHGLARMPASASKKSRPSGSTGENKGFRKSVPAKCKGIAEHGGGAK